MSRPSLISERPSEKEGAGTDAVRRRVEALEFELELARRASARLDEEIRRLGHHVAAVEADRNALRNRLDERERSLDAIRRSSAWRAVQWLRGLVGRRW